MAFFKTLLDIFFALAKGFIYTLLSSRSQRIMMLGFSGVGKSSYMGATYKLLSEKSISGFSIEACPNLNGEHEILCNIGDAIAHGVYPSSTDKRKSYSFAFRYDNEVLLTFDWDDYRGGILETPSQEMVGLYSQLSNTNGVILFFDAIELVNCKNDEKFEKQLDIFIMMVLEAAHKHPVGLFPIAIVITKYDCVSKASLEDSSNYKKIVNGLFEPTRNSSNAISLLCYTSVGKTCVNIQYPLLFTMLNCLSARIDDVMQETKSYNKTAQEYKDKSSIINDISCVFSGETSNSAKASESEKKAQALEKSLSDLKKRMKMLSALIVAEAEVSDTLYLSKDIIID